LKKTTLFGFICLAVILAVMSFAACAQQATPTATATKTVTITATQPGTTVTQPGTTVTQPAVTVTATPAAKAATYTVLDPRAVLAPIPYIALNPRLSSIKNKKIGVVNKMGGNEVALEAVPAALMKLEPTCQADYYKAIDIVGGLAPYQAFVMAHDAIILGNAY